mmetsp:Transcript_27987/g.54412  ORF Transcript_27987/g.54412 Transcript_27987/m.54412 type:complete len:1061 (-) Transcript_27987:183-3365(-)
MGLRWNPVRSRIRLTDEISMTQGYRRLLSRFFLVLLVIIKAETVKLDNIGSREDVFNQCTRKPSYFDLETGETTTTEAENFEEVIVSFKNYKNITDHVAFVHELAGGCTTWHNVARRNAAATLYPTDFIVIEMDEEMGETSRLLEALEKNPEVRALSKERQIDSRHLFGHEVEDVEEPARFKMMTVGKENDTAVELDEAQHHQRQILAQGLIAITKYTGADQLWKQGHTGRGVKVAVFDTGIREHHSSFRNIVERTDWTDENTRDDPIGHGTFVAGVIASTHSQCSGFAPDAEIYAFRVFNRKQVSFTSWFLDAFNYAMQKGIDVLNLSIGGPDFMDRPFVEKVLEMSAHGIIIVSAIGNDGPRYGTLNNPADQLDVIGVGGITYEDTVASFSSRGMTTWELPRGYGRVKPDIVAYGKGIRGPTTSGGCRSLSGTSVASPVVAGMVTLLAEMADKEYLNPAMMKQVLTLGAVPIPNSHVFEQGMGRVDLLKAADLVRNYVPQASAIPHSLDLTQCPYMWPYCTQPAYYSAQPIKVNLTVLNPLSVAGSIRNPRLILNADGYAENNPLVSAEFSYSDVLWPWSGFLAVALRVTKAGRLMSGIVSGEVVFEVLSDNEELSVVSVPLRLELAPPPPREKRLLWDQFHSLRYPSGYFPRDNLAIKSDILDWNGDHIHTNFKGLYDHLRAEGYFIETVGTDWTCVDATLYSTLLLVDPEEAYFDEEIAKLASDVYTRGLSLVVVGEWHNVATMKKLKFLDQNTQSWWLPQTGGANLPQLNRVLEPFHMAYSDRVLDATMQADGKSWRYESGTSIFKFPKSGRLFSVLAKDAVSGTRRYFPVMGIYSTGTEPGNGRIALYGDSNCLDGNHRRGDDCYAALDALLDFTCQNKTNERMFPATLSLKSSFRCDFGNIPVPMDGVHFERYSNVMGEDKLPECLAMVSGIPNVSTFTPPINHSDILPHLPDPKGGFYNNAQQGLPYFALGLFVGACALALYIRFCRMVGGKDLPAFIASQTGQKDGGAEVHKLAPGHIEAPAEIPVAKWGRGGVLHKRNSNAISKEVSFKV